MRVLLDALPNDPSGWFDSLSKAGAGGTLAGLVVAFWRGWIVTKAVYDAVVKERDALRAASDALLKGYQDREAEERRWRQERPLHGTQGERVTP